MGKLLDSREIGWKIKKFRQNAGLTQEKLAEMTDVTFQQIQKYESGKTKLNTDKLQQVAHALGVPVSAFFEEQPGEALSLSEQERKLIEMFRGIKNREIRECFLKIAAATVSKKKRS